ncbi:MAG: tetratricopeptide repeat protein [Desulfobacteraceae bacterium]
MKKIFFLFILVFFPLNLSADNGDKNLSQKAVFCLQKAENFRASRELTKGAELIIQFQKKYPKENHHYLEYLLGTFFLESGKPEQALNSFEKSVRLYPSFCAGWHIAGSTAYDLELYEKAALSFEKAYLVSKKKEDKILFASAVSYLKCGMDEKAFELLNKIIQNWKSDENHINTFTATGIKLNRQNQVSEVLDSLIEKNPEKKLLLKLAANTALSQNNNKKALKYLSIIMLDSETDFKTARLAGDLALSVNSPKRAVEFYEKALEKKHDKKIFQMIVTALMESSDYDKAFSKAEQGLKKYPDCAKLWKLKAYISYERKDYENSYFCASKALKLNSDDKNLADLISYCAAKSNKTDISKTFQDAAGNI